MRGYFPRSAWGDTEVTPGRPHSNAVFLTQGFMTGASKVTLVATAQGGRAPGWELGLSSSSDTDSVDLDRPTGSPVSVAPLSQ